jgi:hypothetical protein
MHGIVCRSQRDGNTLHHKRVWSRFGKPPGYPAPND